MTDTKTKSLRAIALSIFNFCIWGRSTEKKATAFSYFGVWICTNLFSVESCANSGMVFCSRTDCSSKTLYKSSNLLFSCSHCRSCIVDVLMLERWESCTEYQLEPIVEFIQVTGNYGVRNNQCGLNKSLKELIWH